jgi:malate dehydrogenase (oxaloacetate-decarboxylating)(NADP+)
MGVKARKDPRYVVFAEGDNLKVLKAAQICYEEGICYPILLGDHEVIRSLAATNGLDIDDLVVVDPKNPSEEARREKYGEQFFALRGRKGYNRYEATKVMKDRVHFGCMMVKNGEADAVIAGPSRDYSGRLRPALQIIGTEPGVKKVAGMYILLTKKGPLFLADATVNMNPTAEEIADITSLVASEVKTFNLRPRIALLSYSNFGSSPTPEAQMMAKAREIIKQREPNLIVDGEMQGVLVFNNDILKENYPFSELVDQDVNTLIFPNLSSGNIAYNLLREIGSADSIGPVLLGMDKPVHVLQLGSSVRNIVNMTLIAVMEAQLKNPMNNESREEQRKRWWKRRRKEHLSSDDNKVQTAFNG